MSNSQPTIAQIILTAKTRQYQSVIDIAKNEVFVQGDLNTRLPEMLYVERRAVEWANTYIPNDPNLQNTANYLLWLSGPVQVAINNLSPTTLTIVSVTSTEIDLTWVAVPNGVTYTLQRSTDSTFNTGTTTIFTGGALFFNDTGLTASTHYYYRIQVSAPGFISSPYAYADATTQPVVVPITGFFYYNAANPYSTLQGGSDPFVYQVSFNIIHNSPISFNMPSASSPNMYLVVKVPIGENIKSTWFNTVLNNGTIPDAVWQAVLQPAGLPNFSYYVTRVAASMDTTQPLTLS